MKLKVIAALCAIIALTACGESKPANRQQLEIKRDSVTASLIIDRIMVPNDSGFIFLDFSEPRIHEKIRKDPNRIVFLEFNLNDTATLSGRLTSNDSIANIRFSQIILPDGTSDGPFGRELQYNLTQTGRYRLSVHEDMMAGDPWGGVFMVRLALTRQ